MLACLQGGNTNVKGFRIDKLRFLFKPQGHGINLYDCRDFEKNP